MMFSSPTPRPDAAMITEALTSISAVSPAPLTHFTLANGLAVYLREDHRAPLAAVQLWYHVGTSHEPAGHTNLSHLLEHLMFQGSSKLAAGQFSRVIARLGGKANATTLEDATAFDMILPASRLPVVLEIMADAMASATLGRTQFEHEVKVVEDERRLKVQSSPLYQALDRHHELAHAGSPYGAPTFGHAQDLSDMQWDSVQTWYRTWYVPNNATLVVVGAIDPQSLRRQVERYFAAIPQVPLAATPAPRHSDDLQARTQTLTAKGLQSGLYLSFNTPSQATAPTAEVAHALQLLCEVLGKGFSSRLYGSLVRDKGVLKSLRIAYQPLRRADTLLTLTAFSNPDVASPEQAGQAILREIEALRSTPLSEVELESAKLRMLARQLYARDSHEEQAQEIGQTVCAGVDPTAIDQSPTTINALSAATVQHVARQYLRPECMTLTYMQQGEAA